MTLIKPDIVPIVFFYTQCLENAAISRIWPSSSSFIDQNPIKCQMIHHKLHYNDIIISPMVSQIPSLTIVYPTVYSRQRNYQFTGDRWSPTQRTSNTENISIWWCHHVHLDIFLRMLLINAGSDNELVPSCNQSFAELMLIKITDSLIIPWSRINIMSQIITETWWQSGIVGQIELNNTTKLGPPRGLSETNVIQLCPKKQDMLPISVVALCTLFWSM